MDHRLGSVRLEEVEVDYEVDFAVLQRAGARAADVAQTASTGLSQMRIRGVGAAIPGGLSGGVADRLDAAWQSNGREISEAISSYAESLAASAENYRAAEQQATESLESFFGGLA